MSIQRRSEPRTNRNSHVFCGVLALLLVCPLAFGAVEPWSVFLLEVTSAALFMLWAAFQLSSDELTVQWNPLFPPMVVFAGLVLLQLATGRTIYRYATVSGALLYGAYGLTCFLVVQSLETTWRFKILAVSFSAYGFAVAMFALLQGLTSAKQLYWLRTPRGGGWIYGPYVNHNHYAGLMEMLFPIPLVFSLTVYAKGGLRRSAVLASAVMVTTIFLSGSRGGVIAFFCEIIVLFALLLRQRRRIQLRGRLAFASFVILSGLLVGWIGSHELANRLASVKLAKSELTDGVRIQIDRDLIRMFPRRPVLGSGLGTFADIYPQYRSFYSDTSIDEAHNDYLQLLVEMGAAGFITMIWFLWLVFWHASRKLSNWTTDANGAVALAVILGVVGILVHSLVDFNLQIPANAAIFYVLCIIAAMEPRQRPLPVMGRYTRQA